MQQLYEYPKITNFLRREFFPNQYILDIEKEYLKRQTLLSQKPKNVTTPISPGVTRLTWSSFHFADLPETKIKEYRKKFHQFLRMIIDLLGGDECTDSALIHSAASTCFDIFVNNVSQDTQMISLQRAFPTPALQFRLFSELQEIVSSLQPFLVKKKASKGINSAISPELPLGTPHIDPFYYEEHGLERTPFVQPQAQIPTLLAILHQPPSHSKSTEKIADYCIWLEDKCVDFIAGGSDEDRSSLFSLEELYHSILHLLLEKGNDENNLNNQLIDLLGMQPDCFSFIEEIIEHKNDLVKSFTSLKKSSQPHFLPIHENGADQNEKKLMKKIRKQEKMMKKKQHTYNASDTGKDIAPNPLIEDRDLIKDSQWFVPTYTPSGTREDLPPSAPILPPESKRINNKEYEEVLIPAPRPQEYDRNDLVSVSALPEWARLPFEGYTHFNRVQSKVFDTAFSTHENLLVCAPTGCGKTNVALLTILREIALHRSDDDSETIDLSAFKCVYVSPMKALAQEITRTFQSRLKCLGLTVREYTGDMQLTRKELSETQIIVTTPEKWDIATRKSSDTSLSNSVKLLILDEVHLLHEDRGPVLEVLVARTLRLVESRQHMIRIVGLSATLPNYRDIAQFLRVGQKGLFWFPSSYRPVPLEQQFIGVKGTDKFKQRTAMNMLCYEKIKATVEGGHQAMVFVHSRKEAFTVAQFLANEARNEGVPKFFLPNADILAKGNYLKTKKDVGKSRAPEITELFHLGIGCHHAGMFRKDRTLVERLFSNNHISVLCCTATLQWGVNLPAHTVIIKGTKVYNPEHGGFVELSMLDVMQIFGRAGRPQYDISGRGGNHHHPR